MYLCQFILYVRACEKEGVVLFWNSAHRKPYQKILQISGGGPMKTRIEAKPQNLKGDDGYDTFSIRIKHSLTIKLDETADASGRSRNYVISRILEDGVENTVIVEAEQP